LKTHSSSSIEIILYLKGLEDSDLRQAIVFLRKKLEAQATAPAPATATAITTFAPTVTHVLL